jgi:hypothetical protein
VKLRVLKRQIVIDPLNLYIGGLILAMVAGVMATIVISGLDAFRHPDVLHPPIHPEARGLSETTNPNAARGQVYKVISYEVLDKSESVLTYYRDAMARDRWSRESNSYYWFEGPPAEGNSLYFSYYQRMGRRQGITHVVRLVVKPAPGDKTLVELRFVGYGR